MAITTTRSAVIIDALVAGLKASATFADPVRVFDGPVTVGDTMWTQAVFVGFDGDWHESARGQVAPGVDYEAVLINQQFHDLGNTTVAETLDIQCSAEYWSGDATVQTARNGAIGLLNGVETVLRTDPTLAVDGSTIATLQVGNLSYTFDSDGNIGARYRFVVHAVTILLTV